MDYIKTRYAMNLHELAEVTAWANAQPWNGGEFYAPISGDDIARYKATLY